MKVPHSMSQPKVAREFTAQTPAFSATDAARIAHDLFGISGTALHLEGECDQNLRLRTEDGDYILKFSSADYDPALLSLHVAAMTHIARNAPHLPIPRLVQSGGKGVAQLDDGTYVRLMTWMDGVPVVSAEKSPVLRKTVASFAAQVVIALASFDHSNPATASIWNLTQATQLQDAAVFITDHTKRQLTTDAFAKLARFQADLDKLPTQFIHNDIHHHNLLVAGPTSPEITGLIDFGDMMKVPRVVELAVAIAHQLYGVEDVARAIKEMTMAFCERLPLNVDEIEVLPSLVAARLASRESVVARRVAQTGGTGSYDDTISNMGWVALERLMAQDFDVLAYQLRAAST